MAAVVGVPVRMAGAVLDRIARPVPGDDLLGPFLDWVPPAPAGRGRIELRHAEVIRNA